MGFADGIGHAFSRFTCYVVGEFGDQILERLLSRLLHTVDQVARAVSRE